MKLYFGNAVTAVTTGMILALVAIAIPLAKTERMREIWFFVMSCGALVKITVVEFSWQYSNKKTPGSVENVIPHIILPIGRF